jgi:urease accessory protein
MNTDRSKLLLLMHLSDSALPVGAAAHSFGIETLVDEGYLSVERLEDFLRDYIVEVCSFDAYFCCAAYRLSKNGGPFPTGPWLDLNRRLSAFKLPRESRAGSAALGRRFLRLAAELSEQGLLSEALESAELTGVEIHHCTAFGLSGGALSLGEAETALAYNHQTVAALISACQRLMPLGQTRAAKVLWKLKTTLIETIDSNQFDMSNPDQICCFSPIIELASMRHPDLATRLFIS